jgi:hypothetical protein
VDSYALQVFLAVQPPVIHFTNMPEPGDPLQRCELLTIRRASAYPVSSALAKGAHDMESSASVLGEAAFVASDA